VQAHQDRAEAVIRVRKSNRHSGAASDSDSDDGPPPDPDEPAPRPPSPKKEKKSAGEPREVQVSARKSSDDKGGMQPSRVVCPPCDERYSSPYELRMRRLGRTLSFVMGR